MTADTSFTTSQLADYLKVNTETLRYYERIGILSDISRDENGYRIFNISHVKLMVFVIACKNMGFTLKEIKSFFEDSTYTDIISFKNAEYNFDADQETNIKKVIELKINELNNDILTIEKKKTNLKSFLDKMDTKDSSSELMCPLEKINN